MRAVESDSVKSARN